MADSELTKICPECATIHHQAWDVCVSDICAKKNKHPKLIMRDTGEVPEVPLSQLDRIEQKLDTLLSQHAKDRLEAMAKELE